MKQNYERVVEEGMKRLEAAREAISRYAESAEEAVRQADSKMASLSGFINSLEDRAFTRYDPILVGEMDFGKNAQVDSGYSEVRVSNHSASLGDFFSRGHRNDDGKRLSGKYRVLVLFQKVE